MGDIGGGGTSISLFSVLLLISVRLPAESRRRMGVGSSREELDAAKGRLAAAERLNAALCAEKDALAERLQAQAQTLDLQQRALTQSLESSKHQLQQKEVELGKALKQRQLAEELRRSDALLAKRLLNAQLRHLGGDMPADQPGRIMDGGTMAAAIALSAQDELQLRQVRAKELKSI